jgi:hypothetical protein
MKTNKLFFTGLILILWLSLSSCGAYNINFSESTPSQSRANHISRSLEKDSEYNFQYFDILGKTAGVFLINNAVKIPGEVINSFSQMSTNRLKETNLFESIVPPKRVIELLNKHGKIKQLSSIYMDTLTNISISDKDISKPMAEYLNVNSFFVLQVDNWPCSECLLQDRIRIKIKIVNAEFSEILWTGIDEIFTSDNPSEQFPEIAKILLTDLFDNFYNRFKIKWHKKRYHQLAQL